MDKYEIISRIEKFAPPEFAEAWDCSGWLVETSKQDIKKVMLALTVTESVVNQALKNNCDIIISHHPLFTVPMSYKNIDIYCAHTNMDLTEGGTTDSLIGYLQKLGLKIKNNIKIDGFVRYINTNISTDLFIKILKQISPNLRYTCNNYKQELKKIAFCAGSGSEFIEEAYINEADCFVTGDLKFHTALESPIMIFDIGHFESEIQILDVIQTIIGSDVKFLKASEISPFRYL